MRNPQYLVYKHKCDNAGNIVRYKVRYITKGYMQHFGIDYDNTTAPTACLESFRSILHISATLDWDIQQYDIKTVFLHSVLPESKTMFMEQPLGDVTYKKYLQHEASQQSMEPNL
jgi:hypothetical protein